MSEQLSSEPSGSPDPLVCDEIVLLAEIIMARQNGNFAMQAGNDDDDLLAAIEGAESPLDALKRQLRGY